MENLAATLVFVLLAACSDRSSLGDVQSVTPGDKYVLSVEEIKQLTGPARDGDAKALFRLIQYYTLVDSDLDKRNLLAANSSGTREYRAHAQFVVITRREWQGLRRSFALDWKSRGLNQESEMAEKCGLESPVDY